MTDVPLGQRESARLEFKRADALQHLEAIGREVVAMLNAEGGEVWIGIEEQNGFAVRVTPVRDAERERGRLSDHLVDTIEPSPSGSDVAVDVVPHETAQVMVVRVQPGARKPYAQLKGDARRYVKRVDDRLRPMSRDDLRELFVADRQRGERDDPLDAARRALRNERDRRQAEKRPGMWLPIAPAADDIELDVQSTQIRDLLNIPSASGNREEGWTCVTSYLGPTVRVDEIVLGDSPDWRTTIRRDGRVLFEVALQGLYGSGPAKTILPFALIEYIASVFRLARALYAELQGAPGHFVTDPAFFGLEGWVLRPYSPRAVGYALADRKGLAKPFPDRDLVFLRPFVFERDGFLRADDACALRVIAEVYRAYGLRREHIPREFDQNTKRLSFGGAG